MSKKSFFFGFVTGIVVTFCGLYFLGNIGENNDPVQYLEKPVSYENKSVATFKVFQVLGNSALANELTNEDLGIFLGNTVILPGDGFYDDQIITVKNPERVGSYSYTTNNGMSKTVPVIVGDMQ